MAQAKQKTHKGAHWHSSYGFLLACIGAAVGLGNIWKFPYMAGTHGGGAFVLVYLASIFAIAIPIAVAELLVGRRGQSDAVHSVHTIAAQSGKPRAWGVVGTIAVLASFTLLSFYAVIAGWVSYYVVVALAGGMGDLNSASAQGLFNQLLASPSQLILHQVLFLGLIGIILVRDLASGLERANVILVPTLVVMLLIIFGYGVVEGDVGAAMQFLFTPDLSKITPQVLQSAIGHGFFSVGVGAAMLLTYGAYVDKKIDLAKAAITIGIADTAIALLAGIGIFSIVFAQNLDPTSGPGLIFTTLPLAFAQIPFGGALAVIFFVLVYFAALTSGLSLGEVVIRRMEGRFGISRLVSSWLALSLIFILGLASVFSFNIWADYRLPVPGTLGEKSLFEVKDYLTTAYLMPLGGLGIVLFASWAMPLSAITESLGSSARLMKLWLWAARIIAPLGILWIFWENL